jgi:hypothetical protein
MSSPAMTMSAGTKALPSSSTGTSRSSRRRKGPAFLPSEHDELPAGVAFMVSHAGSTRRKACGVCSVRRVRNARSVRNV